MEKTINLNKDKGFIPKPKKMFDKPKKEFDKSKKEFDKDKKNQKYKKVDKDKKLEKNKKFIKPREYDKDKESDKTTGFDKDKKFDKPREFSKDKKFDKPREFDKDKKFDKPREFSKDKKFDKPREFDKDKKFDKSRKFDNDKKIVKPREYDKDKRKYKPREVDKTEEFNKAEAYDQSKTNDNQNVEGQSVQPVKKDKYILNRNKELIRDRNSIIKETVIDEELEFESAEVLFSPTSIDKGTLAMLSVVELNEGDKLLDLGCGYGTVGIYAAKKIGAQNVIMVDKVAVAVKLSLKNAIKNNVEGVKVVLSDAYDDIDDTNFTHILSNPPYHTDFTVAKKFIEKGFNRLALEGKMYMVTKRKEWYKNRFIAIFGGVKIWEIDDYFVFMAVKKSTTYAPKKKNK